MFFFGDKYFKLVAVDQPSDRNQEPKFAISFLQKSAAQAVSLKEHRRKYQHQPKKLLHRGSDPDADYFLMQLHDRLTNYNARKNPTRILMTASLSPHSSADAW